MKRTPGISRLFSKMHDPQVSFNPSESTLAHSPLEAIGDTSACLGKYPLSILLKRLCLPCEPLKCFCIVFEMRCDPIIDFLVIGINPSYFFLIEQISSNTA